MPPYFRVIKLRDRPRNATQVEANAVLRGRKIQFFKHSTCVYALREQNCQLPFWIDEIKEAVATRRDMRTMLNVIGRPVTLSPCVITLVEQRVESFQDEGLVGLLNRGLHFALLTQWPRPHS